MAELNERAAKELFSIAEKYCSQELKSIALHIIYTFNFINERQKKQMIKKFKIVNVHFRPYINYITIKKLKSQCKSFLLSTILTSLSILVDVTTHIRFITTQS